MIGSCPLVATAPSPGPVATLGRARAARGPGTEATGRVIGPPPGEPVASGGNGHHRRQRTDRRADRRPRGARCGRAGDRRPPAAGRAGPGRRGRRHPRAGRRRQPGADLRRHRRGQRRVRAHDLPVLPRPRRPVRGRRHRGLPPDRPLPGDHPARRRPPHPGRRPGRPPGRARRPHRPAHPLGRAPRPQQPARGRPARPAHRPAPGAGAPVVRPRAGHVPAPAPPPWSTCCSAPRRSSTCASCSTTTRSSPSSPPPSCACSPPPERPAPQNADSITSTSLPTTHATSKRTPTGADVVLVEPAHAEAAQPQLLGAGDGLGRGAVGVRAAGLDLAEHQRAPVGQHEVDLAVAAAPVAADHGVAPRLVPARRQRLAPGAQRPPAGGHPWRPLTPAPARRAGAPRC